MSRVPKVRALMPAKPGVRPGAGGDRMTRTREVRALAPAISAIYELCEVIG
jgi:hypothetical protein